MERSLMAVLVLFFLCMFLHMNESVHVSKRCLPGQKLRWFGNNPICCFTIPCHPGQKFAFCTEDQGHDTCQNCPIGYTHFDDIHTKVWDYIIDPCTEVDDCSDYSDLTTNKKTGQCECDRSRGYYGRDRNKCFLDDGRCKKPGHMLTMDGKCVECDEDHFKSNDGYSLCQEKTRCNKKQEVNDPGSLTSDRTCRVKSSTILPTIKPPISKSNSSNDTSVNSAGRNIGKGSNNTSKEVNQDASENESDQDGDTTDEREENQSNNHDAIITAITVPFCILFVVIGVFIYCCRKGRMCANASCCTFHINKSVNTNVNANSIINGDNNTMRTCSHGVDAEAEAGEGSPLREMENCLLGETEESSLRKMEAGLLDELNM